LADIKVKRGYDVLMVGAPDRTLTEAPRPSVVAVRPNEFRGIRAKLLVKERDRVSCGQSLFHDRDRTEIPFVSPGGGEVIEVRYGPRRVCEEIFIGLDDQESWVEHTSRTPEEARELDRARIVEALVEGGLWTSLLTRPYSVIPSRARTPAAIFISASDSSPLPFDASFSLSGRDDDFQLGIDLLGRLTDGKVHLCLEKDMAPSTAFNNVSNCERHRFSGPYPSGQIEVQIHHLMPHRKGQEVWFVDAQDVAGIGEFFRTGRYPVSRVVAIGGEGATVRKHFVTRRGVTADHLDPGASPALNRFVSGNVLSGRRISSSSGLGHYDSKFCVVPEGDQPELIGWMLPGFRKMSRYRAYASALVPPSQPHVTTALGGGVRAHVATGIHEDVCAVDILPGYLMRALVVNDFEEAESLGLADCAECGLCTYVDPSKIEFGEIIQNGIEEFLKEGEG
jgi:Na+-transporting NADH:ubiquinone oxidoreductase subunit A